MTETTDIQKSVFDMLKKTLCESIEANLVNMGAIEIITPFIDWKGYPVSIYVTRDGKITDGDETINQLRSLRVIEDFEEWPFQTDFFHRYQIQQTRDSLEPIDPESGDALISYIQGIARIPSFFERKAITNKVDNYPTIARQIAEDGLIEEYKMSPLDVSKYTHQRIITLKSGLDIQNDMSPKNNDIMIKIISNASSLTTTQNEHISHKILQPVLWKQENDNVLFYPILDNKEKYSKQSIKILEKTSEEIIETKIPQSKRKLARLLIEV